MPLTVSPLTSVASFQQPCEAGHGTFLPAGDPGRPCPNRRMLLVLIPGADRVVELCSDHAQALQRWWA